MALFHHTHGNRAPARLRDEVRRRGAITIRPATPADHASLRRLAALASRPVPDGHLTVAETEAGIVAALGDSASISDPFAVTADLIELLRLRREQLAAA